MTAIARRKLEHLDLCAKENVESGRTTLLEEVRLFHEALPELALAEIDPSVRLFGRRLEVPIVISGMTGGADRAREINRALARLAQELGLAMGLGSQRPMLDRPELAGTYRVRDLAPDVLLFANLGCVQARDASSARVAELVEAVGADALCLHLNVAQELVQDEGDRDFRGCLDAIGRLADDLEVPVIAKETGCGLSPSSLRRLREAGVAMVDVAGAGGTSWPGVESLRGSERQRERGGLLREWGIPTAASIVYARRLDLAAIASGGIRSAHDIVAALVLGASAVGLALPFLRAFESGGEQGLFECGRSLADGLRSLMLLLGARSVAELAHLPVVLGPELEAWTRRELARPLEIPRRPLRSEAPRAREVAL